jgi:hypothetical protein
MSTKIEDLSDTDSELSLELETFENEVDNVDLNNELQNFKALKYFFNSIKDPVLVTSLMWILSHPVLVNGILRIPGIHTIDGFVSINTILAILTGIIFFLIRHLF